MSNAKRRTLIAIQAIVIALFLIAIIGLSFGNAKAEEGSSSPLIQQSIEDRNTIDNLHVGGFLEEHDANARYAAEGKAAVELNNVSDVQSFLQNGGPNGETVGYLGRSITGYSWSGSFTNQIMKGGLTFDGNGYSITLNPSSMNTAAPWVSFSNIYNEAKNTYFKAASAHSDLDLNGAFVGYIPPSSNVINTQFIVDSSVHTYVGGYSDGFTSTGSGSVQKTSGSGCGGYVAAYCSGVINNCSITVNENKYMRMLKETESGAGTSVSRNTYAFGGMVGVLAGPAATVSNSSVNLKSGSLLYVEINAAKQKNSNSRAYVGGLVGWMGDGSNAYNLYCEGTGTLRATSSNSTATPNILSYAGIAVGSASATQDGATAGDVAGTENPGTVNGVISSWSGMAYYRATDSNYNMSGTTYANGNSDDYVQGIIVGAAGKQGVTDDKVTNLYVLGDPYAITIGFSFTAAQINGSVAAGRAIKSRKSVTVKESVDSSESYTDRLTGDVALHFSSTDANSTVWVTYDLSKDPNHIFWAATANKSNTSIVATREKTKYFCQFATATEAQKFDYARIELQRGLYSEVEIDFELGRALYYVAPSSSTMTSLNYGSKLTTPSLTFYSDSARKSVVNGISGNNYNYYRTVQGSSSVLDETDGYKDAGTYTTFIYTEQATDGSNYNDIDLLDEENRFVTYIQDSLEYIAYFQAHPDYKYIDPLTKKKDFDTWQPRYTQTINQKNVELKIDKPADKNIPITNGVYRAVYEGESIVFTGSVEQRYLVSERGDTNVSATLRYYRTDDDFNYDPATDEVTSMLNVGKYMIVADTLSNSNYTFNPSLESSYAKLEIAVRPTMVDMNNNLAFEKVTNDTYKIKLGYTGFEQLIKYASGEISVDAEYMKQNDLAFYFYNVKNDDAAMIQFDILGMDGSNVYNAYDVPAEGEEGSYKVVISFADGQAASNYSLPPITTFIVEITPIDIAFEEKTKEQSTFLYGKDTPESDDNKGYFAFALDNGVPIEPTTREYKIWDDSVGDYVPYTGGSPRNVGKYQIIYTVDHAVERNYNTTTKTYEVEIKARPVTFTFTNDDEIDDQVYGRDYTPGMGVDKSMLSGSFGKYSSTTDSGLSTNHGAEAIVGYRYQRIGNYGDEVNFTPLTDMNDIGLLPATIQDAGIYVIYPILLIPAGGGVYTYAPEEAGNYKFTLDYKTISIKPLDVTIILDYTFTKAYSKELPTYNGAANVEENRIWKYATGSNEFLEDDEIKVYLQFYANEQSTVGDYKVMYAGCEGLKATNAVGMNKADNYTVVAEGIIKLEITSLEVFVKTFVSNNKITYGDEAPTYSYQIEGENSFTEFDLEDMTASYKFYRLGSDVAIDGEPKDAGSYEVALEFDNDNYKIVSSGRAILTIEPKTISVTNVAVNGSTNVIYDGAVHYPTIANIEFDGKVDGDDITVSFAFYDALGNKVKNPQNAGTYTAKVEAGVSVLNADDLTVNGNYKLDAVSSATATVVIEKRAVTVTVANGQMFYLEPDSLKAVGQNSDYDVTDGSFVDDLQYKLVPMNSEYGLGTHTDGVGITFLGDAASNYDITVIKGELEVVSNDLSSLGKYAQITYDGKNYEDVKDTVIYTGANLYDKFGLVTSKLLENKLSVAIATDANGNNKTTEVINAKTYYMVITSLDGDLRGKLVLEFTVAPAQRVISASDINMEVHYNKIVLSSSVANLQYSVNGGLWFDADGNGVYEYDEATPLSNYSIQVRVKPNVDSNYSDSNVVVIYTTTGINAGELMDQINAIEKITFSNVAAYKELLSRLEQVSEDDKSLIDNAKIAALNSSFEELLAQANSVIAGAQSVTAKAVGRGSGSVAATSLALASTGLGLSAVGLALGLISVKRRKEDEVESNMSNNAKTTAVKSRSFKKASKVIVAVILIALIAVFALSACENKEITQEDVLNLASFKTPSNENMRAYEITVSYGSDIVYQNINGEVTSNELITPPDFNLASSGSGFDFNIEYFTNTSFVTSRTTATFTADVEDVSSFLGRANAENAKVTVVVDIVHERLSKIEISYDEGGFSTKVVSNLLY
ncbi:MAG: hypothetical protein K2G37_01080 [Clostridia bacterium]|nr:hypothetical protein [Clostridia bacterium]MDE7328543.1 hypothetical protein [Clostridia bacterium]